MILDRAYSQKSMPPIHRSQSLIFSIALQASVLWLAVGSLASAQTEPIVPPLPDFPPSLDLPPPLNFPPSLELPPFPSEPVARPAQYETAAEALEALKTASVVTHSEIVAQLKAMGVPVMPELRQALTSSSPQVSSAAAEVLGSFGSDAAPAISDLLAVVGDRRSWKAANDDAFFGIVPGFFTWGGENYIPTPPANPLDIVGVNAIAALGQIGKAAKPMATPVLTDLLNDPNPWVQLHSGWSLMRLGTEVPVLPTYMALLQRQESDIRQATAWVLDEYDSPITQVLRTEATPEQVTTLVELLADDNQLVSVNVSSGLKKLGVRAVPQLVAALDQPNILLRWKATQTLGYLEGEAIAALPRLSKQLNDPIQYEVPPAPWSPGLPILPDFSGIVSSRPSYSKPSNPDQALNVAAALSIGAIGQKQPKAVDQGALRQKLNDPNPRMRLAVAWAILSTTPPENSTGWEAYWSQQSSLVQTVGEIAQIGRQPVNSIDEPKRGSLRHDALDLLESFSGPASKFLLPHYIDQVTAEYVETPDQTAEKIVKHQTDTMTKLGGLGVKSLEAIPVLRKRFLNNSDKVLRDHSATVLSQIAMDAQRQALQGELPKATQQQVMMEMKQVAAVMRSGKYRFNAEPVERVMTALDVLGRL